MLRNNFVKKQKDHLFDLSRGSGLPYQNGMIEKFLLRYYYELG